MRLSARNQIKGKILDIKQGTITAHVRVEIAPGQVITSSITNEAVEDLALRAGIEAKRVRPNILSLKSHVSFHQLRTSCRISAGPSRADS